MVVSSHRQDKKRACYHLLRNLSSSEYESESETSTDSTLPLYTSLPPSSLLLSLSPLPINSLPPYHYNMSQHNYPAIIRQLQEQLAVQQAQIQALLAEGVTGRRRGGGGATEVAKLQSLMTCHQRFAEFILAYKLYIRMNLKEELVEEQVQ